MNIIFVPQYENLKLDHILDFGRTFPKVVAALPNDRETRKMSRSYICNVINTLVPERFGKWVTSKMSERNLNLVTKQDLNICLDADIAKAYAASTAVNRKLFFSNCSCVLVS